MIALNVTLNFSKKDFKAIKKALEVYPTTLIGTDFEEMRWKISSNVVILFKSGKMLIQGPSARNVSQTILEKVKIKDELILGIDETGRGENFGVFVVAGVLAYRNSMRELRDSKKTTKIEQKFEIVKQKALQFEKIVVSPIEIDSLREQGINLNQIQANMVNSLIDLFKDLKNARIIVDGGLIKGIYSKAEFLKKGDDLEPVIGAASIVAKYFRENNPNKNKRKTWGKKL